MNDPLLDERSLVDRAVCEAERLLSAAEFTWDQPVTHCPGWTVTALVRHMGGIFAWMAAIVSTGEPASFRALPSAPTSNDALREWYLDNLDRTSTAMADADPATSVWTFSSRGDHRVDWWRRRLAVEVSIHRWDVEHVVALQGGAAPSALDGTVAGIGIEEFVDEFLPGLLADCHRDRQSQPTGILHLHTNDAASDTWLDLDAACRVDPSPGHAATSIEGTRSDILLWLTNREPASLAVQGSRELLTQWMTLRR